MRIVVARPSVASAEIEGLLARFDATVDVAERAALLVQVGRLLELDLGDTDQAYDAYEEAFFIDPANDEALTRLEALARARGTIGALAAVAAKKLEAEPDRARGMLLCEVLVRWYSQELGLTEQARTLVEGIKKVDATHWLVHMVQAAVYAEHGDGKRELESLDRAVLSARRADDRFRIHLVMASRYRGERSRDVARARKHFVEAHKLAPRRMEPLLGLEAIAVEAADSAALADVLAKQAEADVGASERAAILVRLAKIQEEDFKKPDRAAQTLERAFDADPTDQATLDALERCYRGARMWPELASTLERSATLTRDPAVRASRLRALGEVLETRIGDLAAAIRSWERVEQTVPNDEAVQSELARLTEKVGDVMRAARHRMRLAELAKEPALKARQYVVAGQLLLPHDGEAARRAFEAATEADPTNTTAWNALAWDARGSGDLGRAAKYVQERAATADAPRSRANLFVELAELRAKLGEADAVEGAYAAAFAADPSNEVAALGLVRPYVAAQRWAEAEPACDVALAAAERDHDTERMFELRRAATAIARGLAKPDRALVHALAAFELRRDSVPAAEDLVAIARQMMADPAVLEASDALLAAAKLADELWMDSRVALADVLSACGHVDAAAYIYDGVLSVHPDHPGALAGRAQSHAASREVVDALHLERRLAHTAQDEGERYERLVKCAQGFMDLAGDPALAAQVYEDARGLRPKELPTLHKLLALYQRMEHWPKVLEITGAIAEADGGVARRAKAWLVMGQIAREKIGDRDRAKELFARVLEHDPDPLAAFERISAALTQDKDWPALVAMYRRLIDRVADGGDKKLLHALHHQLGLLYRDRLRDLDAAIGVFRGATILRPEVEEDQVILRELLAATGRVEGAVAVTLDRVRREPADPTPYAALLDMLLADTRAPGAVELACRVASAMRAFGVAHPQLAAIRASRPPLGVEEATASLGPEGVGLLLYRELDPTISRVFQIVAPALVEVIVSRLSIREKMSHPGPPLKGQAWLERAFAKTAATFGMPAPKLHTRRTPGPPLSPAASRVPAVLVDAGQLAGLGKEVLAFMVGKRVFELAPPIFARSLCPSVTELKQLLHASIRIGRGSPDPQDLPLKNQLGRDALRELSATVGEAMDAGVRLDVGRWSRLADLSSSCAGLLACGDLDAARAAMAIEPQLPGDLAPKEKLRELARHYLSDEHTELRRRIGLSHG
ncbi:MAG: hypothetical protein KC657_07695 [Myxococcales bacterium]|nr:hypothetical protein [Myxococcales bacterium]